MPSIQIMVPKTLEITAAEEELIKDLFRTDKKVCAIKFLKKQYELSLYEAKHFVDAINEKYTFQIR